MVVIRRIYFLLVSAISLNSVVWAFIALMRELFTPEIPLSESALAFETAVILVGLPLFLVHWLRAQRLATADAEERTAALRRFYLYGILTGFIIPFAVNGFALLHALLRAIFDVSLPRFSAYPIETLRSSLIYYPVGMLVLALFALYHWQLVRREEGAGETRAGGVLRALFILGFSGAGLGLSAVGLTVLLQWLLLQIGETTVSIPNNLVVSRELTRLAVGLALWLPFWRWAQRRYGRDPLAQPARTMRNFYLYTVVFISTVTVVGSATIMLAGLLGALLGAPFGGDIRNPLATLLVMGIVWGYHGRLLIREIPQTAVPAAQAAIRRLYLYLVAGVGLLALLIGVGGVIGVTFFVLDGEPFIGELRGALSWFIAALTAGLPVWLLPWRRLQLLAAPEIPDHQRERESLTRKIFLYLYLFLATMTLLGTAIFIVSQLVELLLGARDGAHLLRDLGMALAYAIIAAAVAWYHGRLLQDDNRLLAGVQQAEIAAQHVTLLLEPHPELMRSFAHSLQAQMPALQLTTIPAAPEAAAATTAGGEIDILIRPVCASGGNGAGTAVLQNGAAHAHQLLLPLPERGSSWLGIAETELDQLVREAQAAIVQFAGGEPIHPPRRLGVGGTIGLVLGTLLLLAFILPLILSLIFEFLNV
jgi:hypothetical protein